MNEKEINYSNEADEKWVDQVLYKELKHIKL